MVDRCVAESIGDVGDSRAGLSEQPISEQQMRGGDEVAGGVQADAVQVAVERAFALSGGEGDIGDAVDVLWMFERERECAGDGSWQLRERRLESSDQVERRIDGGGDT